MDQHDAFVSDPELGVPAHVEMVAVGVENRAGCDHLIGERFEVDFTVGGVNSPQEDPSQALAMVALDSNSDCDFALVGVAPTVAGVGRASKERAVHVNDDTVAAEAFPIGADHGMAQFMHPYPRSLVRTEPQHPLQAKSRHTVPL